MAEQRVKKSTTLARLADWFLNHDPRHADKLASPPPAPKTFKTPKKADAVSRMKRRLRRARNKAKFSQKRIALLERHVGLHRDQLELLNAHARKLEQLLHQANHPEIAALALFDRCAPYVNPAPQGAPYVKLYKSYKHITALSGAQALRLESTCLRSLTESGDGAEHFPSVHQVDPDNTILVIRDCGLSLKARQMQIPVTRQSYFEQAERIAAQLDRCNIWHLDLMNTGQNLCFDEDGVMRLIDFDIAWHPGLPVMSGSIATRLEKARAEFDSPGALARRRFQQLYRLKS